MLKKIIKLSSLTIFSVSLIILPIEQAHAFVGYSEIGSLAVGGEVVAAAAPAGSAVPLAVGAAALGVGVAAGALGVSYVCSTGAIQACNVNQPLSNKPSKQIPPPAAPATSPRFPSCNFDYSGQENAGCFYNVNHHYYLNSAQTSCDETRTFTPSGSTPISTPQLNCSGSVGYFTSVFSPVSVYPAGYDNNGNLNNPRLAQKDGNIDLGTAGNGASILPDADTMSPDKLPKVSSAGDNVKYGGYIIGADGQKHMIWIDVQKQNLADAQADLYRMNVSYIEHNMGQCATNPSCQSLGSTPQEIKTQTLQISDGIIVGTSTTTQTGTVADVDTTYVNPNTQQTQTVQPGELVVTTPDITGHGLPPVQVVTSTPVTPQTQTLTLPNDYARTGEAQTAANTTNDLLKGPAVDTVTPLTSVTTSLDGIRDNITNLPTTKLPTIDSSWIPSFLPGQATACVPFPIDANPTMGLASGFVGHGEIDICDKLALARSLFGWFLGMLTIFFIFRAFIRSNKAV